MKTLLELANLVGGEVVGDADLTVAAVTDLVSAGPGDLTFLVKEKDRQLLEGTRASAVVVPRGFEFEGVPVLRVANPALAIAKIHTALLQKPFGADGIHATALLGDNCHVAEEVSIGPRVILGNDVVIGRRVFLAPGVVLGDGVSVGDDTEIKANVSVADRCVIGKRVIIHSGTVIGSDGFGYVTDENGRHWKRPHVGIVQIEDDVEIGANVCVDRATFGRTWIRRGAKIDNLVQVAHNVEIGEDALVVSQAGISGSSTLGQGVVVGGQVGISDHVRIGDRAMIGSKSGVHNDVPERTILSGYPAFSHRLWLRACSVIPKLPELVKDIRLLKKQVAELCEKSK